MREKQNSRIRNVYISMQIFNEADDKRLEIDKI